MSGVLSVARNQTLTSPSGGGGGIFGSRASNCTAVGDCGSTTPEIPLHWDALLRQVRRLVFFFVLVVWGSNGQTGRVIHSHASAELPLFVSGT